MIRFVARRAQGLSACLGLSLVIPTGAGAKSPAPIQQGPWNSFGYASQVTCGPRPTLLTGRHMDLKLSGICSHVRVAGAHNDIGIAPHGQIEITGEHNDVTWHLPAGIDAPPVLTDHGQSNAFHKGE